MSALRISVSTRESVSFGDHGDRLTRSHVTVDGETVEDLVRRVFPNLGETYRQHDATDEVVLRVMVGADGKVTGEAVATPGQVPF